MKRKYVLLGVTLIIFLCTMVLAIQFGSYSVSSEELFAVIDAHLHGLVYPNSSTDTIVWKIRLPRVLTAAMIGIALSISGAMFQGIFRNPLVEPYVLGVSSGSAFGAAVCIVYLPMVSKSLMAFIFAVISMFLAYGLAYSKENMPVVRLILSGMIVSAVFTALLNFLKVLASDSKLREITFWTMGGFYTSEWAGALRMTLIAGVGLLLAWALGWKLNVLAMGDQEAKTLGIHVGRLKFLLILSATFLTASSVAEAGIISWVGLMVPHAARMLIGPDHRYMIPFSALLGGTFLVICDTLARTLIMGELPISIITSILGAPYLIFLLRHNRKVYFE